MPICTKPPGSVVAYFHIFEYSPAHGFTGCKRLAVDQFYFEGVEKVLGASVVVAVAFTAHTANQIMQSQEGLILR